VFIESVAAMMTMNEVVDGWNRQHVGSIISNQLQVITIDEAQVASKTKLTA